jgi:hypothetical protein
VSDAVIDETVRAVRKFLKKPDGSTPQSNQILIKLRRQSRIECIIQMSRPPLYDIFDNPKMMKYDTLVEFENGVDKFIHTNLF